MARKRKQQRRAPGTGYTSPLDDGRVKAHYPKGDGAGYFVKRCDSMAEAEAWLKSFEDRKANKIDLTGGRQTLGMWLERWLIFISDDLKAKTKADYAFKLGYLEPLAGIRLSDLMPDHVDDVMGTLGAQLAETTTRQIRGLLSRALKEAQRRRYITFNAAETGKRQKAPERKQAYRMSVVETGRLLRAAEPRPEQIAWWLILVLGLREGEILGLRRGDLYLGSAALTIRQQYTNIAGRAYLDTPKSEAGIRTLPIPKALIPMFETHLHALTVRAARATKRGTWQEHTLVFPGKSGRPMNPSSLLHILVRDLLPPTHLPHLTVHHLRHNAGSFYTNVGAPEIISNALLGHAPSNVTRHYARPDVEAMRPWAERVYSLLSGAVEQLRRSA